MGASKTYGQSVGSSIASAAVMGYSSELVTLALGTVTVTFEPVATATVTIGPIAQADVTIGLSATATATISPAGTATVAISSLKLIGLVNCAVQPPVPRF